jgi:hypothetical protein
VCHGTLRVTLRSGKTKGMKCCVTRWCLIKELNYYQTHPQQQRIASRRLCFCNVALHKGHTLIHMATSFTEIETNSRSVLMKRMTALSQHGQGHGTKIRIRRLCCPEELAAGVLMAVTAPHHTTKEYVVTIHRPLL